MANDTQITADEWNAIAAYYNAELGTSIANVAVGDPITASFFAEAWDDIYAAAKSADRFVSLPPKNHFIKGGIIHKELWGEVGEVLTATTLSYDYNGSFTVPAGVTKVMFNWVVGGGGGGGAGTELGRGGGGAGGGSGGVSRYVELPVKTNDKIVWTVGAAGLGATGAVSGSVIPSAGNGGDTVVTINSQEVLRSSGGKAGASSSTNTNSIAPAPGGLGGSPNGLTGQTGPTGVSDSASSYGAAGAPGPLAGSHGGAGGGTGGGDPMGTGASCGKAGVGFGSGGGGGGSHDRQSNARCWSGGNGGKGYIEFTYPSQGATGGSPAQDNSGYSSVITGSGGGGYTGAGIGGIGGSNASGDAETF